MATAARTIADEHPLSQPSSRAGAQAEGIPGVWIVATIAVLVVLVSLPRFRAHVLDANREDATLALALLGQRVFDPAWVARVNAGQAPSDLHELIQTDARLMHRFPDARAVLPAPGTRAELLHHGYLFDTGHVVADGRLIPALVAWPETFGQTGDLAFARTGDGAVYAHRNDGLWTGTRSGLLHADLADEGWRAVEGGR